MQEAGGFAGMLELAQPYIEAYGLGAVAVAGLVWLRVRRYERALQSGNTNEAACRADPH
jgi:hypothetical protein